MPRFAILEHDWPTKHWDFLLEAGDVLRAWRLLEEPDVGEESPAEANFDHRLIYLDFEGPLTGDRGRAVRWDTGTFEWIVNGEGRVVVELAGGELTGQAILEKQTVGWQYRYSPGNAGFNPPSAIGD